MVLFLQTNDINKQTILKLLPIILLALFFSNFLFAQNPAQKPLIFGNNNTNIPTKPNNFEEYLVQLALTNSPELEGARYDIEARNAEIGIAKKEWMRNLSGGFNFNDVSFPYFLKYNLGWDTYFGKTIDTNRFSRIATYPLWNINLGINLFDLKSRKNRIQFAENRKKISIAEETFKRQKIRGEVLKRYQEFLETYEILKIRLQALDVADANKTQISSLFSVNKAKFEDYNTANKTYFEALESKSRSESDVKLKRIALEEMIGVKWESVEKVKESYDVLKK